MFLLSATPAPFVIFSQKSLGLVTNLSQMTAETRKMPPKKVLAILSPKGDALRYRVESLPVARQEHELMVETHQAEVFAAYSHHMPRWFPP